MSESPGESAEGRAGSLLLLGGGGGVPRVAAAAVAVAGPEEEGCRERGFAGFAGFAAVGDGATGMREAPGDADRADAGVWALGEGAWGFAGPAAAEDGGGCLCCCLGAGMGAGATTEGLGWA